MAAASLFQFTQPRRRRRVQSRREGSREHVIYGLHDNNDIHQVSKFSCFLHTAESQTKKVKVTSRSNFKGRSGLSTDKYITHKVFDA